MMDWSSPRCKRRIAVVRRRLTKLGYRPCGVGNLPGFDRVELWSIRNACIYLACTANGWWNVIAPVCEDGSSEDIFAALEQFASSA